ncbi:hypothetical protein [Actinomadura alba]|uniref:Uncharacterized protein n=1 Tax=Actinomadura alba TaxID=406431 RepID=A0ABR7LR49_9ACTN|nr:hypothetical protein [Actinomadura alba]MBC6467318.1 hypothetical protein [Actinomadura alba]
MALNSDQARIALGVIRLFNGTMAMVAPEFMLRRLGANPVANGVAIYPFRMFGVRTVVLALDLLWPPTLGGEARRRAQYAGIAIHATDAVSAASAGLRHQLPRRVAAVATAISVTNTALAITIARADCTCR